MKFGGQIQNGNSGQAWPREWVADKRKPQGVALVATLIMLSLVTFMTVAFLGVARRERRGMEVHLSQGDAQNYMHAALSAAQTEIISRMLSPEGRADRPDPWSYSLMVSTNYMSPGFTNNWVSSENVNDFWASQFALESGDINFWLRHLGNLQILPRAPVFDPNYTNGWNNVIRALSNIGPREVESRYGRFFLDFNRNRQYEPTFSRGLVPTGNPGGTGIQKYTGGLRHSIYQTGHGEWLDYVPAFQNNTFGHYVGDPQWIGILEDPNQPHGPSNQFVGRYAFLVMPAGKSLDINNIHNQNKLYYNGGNRSPFLENQDGYMRNHGVGSWEINLAAFLATLNTNVNNELNSSPNVPFSWWYGLYDPSTSLPNQNFYNSPLVFNTFFEAASLLRYRLNVDENVPQVSASMLEWLGNNSLVANYLSSSGADLMGQFTPGILDGGKRLAYYNNNEGKPWIGATNPIVSPSDFNTDIRFQTVHDLFAEGNGYDDFILHLRSHSHSASNFVLSPTPAQTVAQERAIDDRYTFYRLLSQMGTHSKPAAGKINLNWNTRTVDGNWAYPEEASRFATGSNGMYGAWSPIDFFTNVAQVLIDSSIKTNVSLNRFPVGADPSTEYPGFFRYVTNYTLGSLSSFDGTNLILGNEYDRFALIGRISRYKPNNTSEDWRPTGSGWWYNYADGATNFFTNHFVVKTNHTLELTNITVYPFNQYTPVLHRLLQVTANLHETAGNSREWDPRQAYVAGDMVRRFGRYYVASAGSSNMDPTNATSWALSACPGLPHVFRPIFRYNTNLNSVYISEWLEVTNATDYLANVNYLNLADTNHLFELRSATLGASSNSVYNYTLSGFPLVIGAKGPVRDTPSTAPLSGSGGYQAAGLPNFNEVALKTLFSVTRKLELTKTNASDIIPRGINTMYIVGLRTALGAEAWNPYRYSSYPRALQLRTTNTMTVLVENEMGPLFTNVFVQQNVTNIAGGNWAGAQGAVEYTGQPAIGHQSFQSLLDNQEWQVAIEPSIYFPPAFSNFAGIATNGAFLPIRTTNAGSLVATDFRRTNLFPAMQLTLTVSNWLTYTAVDTTYNRIIDHVNLTNLAAKIDLIDLITRQVNTPSGTPANAVGQYFDDTLVQSPFPGTISNLMPAGVVRQINHSLTLLVSNNVANTNAIRDWRAFDPGANNVAASIARFRNFVGQGPGFGGTAMFTPFSPTIVVEQDVRFEANDPLVHYLTSDLTMSRTNLTDGQDVTIVPGINITNLDNPVLLRQQFGLPKSIGRLNAAYRPWGGSPTELTYGKKAYSEHFNMGLKDPGVHYVEDYDFPDRKFGSIGWMGRVHRGTPWQTIYMKSRVPSVAEWRDWGQDPDTHPTNDWNLFDNITVHPNRKAASGLLGVNQTNLAAWAAVLGGLNYTYPQQMNGRQFQPTLNNGLLHPTTTNYIQRIHAGIVRSRHENYSFSRLGQILSVPELSVGSPVLYRGVRDHYEGSGVNAYVYRSHRGIRWLAVSAIDSTHPQPPSVREHQIPVFATPNDMNNFIFTNGGVAANTYVWYRDPQVGLQLYYSKFPNSAIPSTNGVVNGNWNISPWREAQQDPLQEEAFAVEETMVERIPQKIMGMLRRDATPRLVVYAFGQALAPADQSKYLFPGQYYGMVTNYQVVSEVSSRTVLRVEGIPENGLIPFNSFASPVVTPRIVVEDHKLLGRQ